MRIEVNYQGETNRALEEKLYILMKEIGAKQFCKGFRAGNCGGKEITSETYLWFDLQDDA